jgi:hypothetical protein
VLGVLAATGPISTAILEVAAAVGAGVLLGCFLAGTLSLRRRADVNDGVEIGCLGGWFALLVLVTEWVALP